MAYQTDYGGIAWCSLGSSDFRAVGLSLARAIRCRQPWAISAAGCVPAIGHVLERLPSNGPTDLRNSYGSARVRTTERTGTESESKRERSRRMDEQSDHLSPPIAVRRSSIPHRRTHLTGVSDRIVESLTAPHKTADVSTVKSRRYVYFDSPLLVHSSGPSRLSSLRISLGGFVTRADVKELP